MKRLLIQYAPILNRSSSGAIFDPTYREYEVLETLKINDNLVIKRADKGSAVVVMNKSDYVDNAHKLLSDTRYYEKLTNDPTDDITKEVTHAIAELYEHRHNHDNR